MPAQAQSHFHQRLGKGGKTRLSTIGEIEMPKWMWEILCPIYPHRMGILYSAPISPFVLASEHVFVFLIDV
jgi:hypothetical protein